MLPQQQVVGSVKCISTFHFWIPIFVGQKRWQRPVANVPIKSICHLLLNNLHFFIQLIVNFCISFPHCLIQIVSEPCKFTQTLKLQWCIMPRCCTKRITEGWARKRESGSMPCKKSAKHFKRHSWDVTEEVYFFLKKWKKKEQQHKNNNWQYDIYGNASAVPHCFEEIVCVTLCVTFFLKKKKQKTVLFSRNCCFI